MVAAASVAEVSARKNADHDSVGWSKKRIDDELQLVGRQPRQHTEAVVVNGPRAPGVLRPHRVPHVRRAVGRPAMLDGALGSRPQREARHPRIAASERPVAGCTYPAAAPKAIVG